jgi:hypothetical protein
MSLSRDVDPRVIGRAVSAARSLKGVTGDQMGRMTHEEILDERRVHAPSPNAGSRAMS